MLTGALRSDIALAALDVQVLPALLLTLLRAAIPVFLAFGLPAAIALLQRGTRLRGRALLWLHLLWLALWFLALRFLPLWLFATGFLLVRLLFARLAILAVLVPVLLHGERGGGCADGEQCPHQRSSKPAGGELAGHDLLHLRFLHRLRTIRAVRAVSGVKDESILRFSSSRGSVAGITNSYSASPPGHRR